MNNCVLTCGVEMDGANAEADAMRRADAATENFIVEIWYVIIALCFDDDGGEDDRCLLGRWCYSSSSVASNECVEQQEGRNTTTDMWCVLSDDDDWFAFSLCTVNYS